MDVRLVDEPSIPVVVVRQVASAAMLPKVVPQSCGEAWDALRAQGQRGGRNIAIYWDGAIRLEAGVEFAGEFRATARVVRSATPAGLAATVTHLGPYQKLGAAHEAIHAWCAANGYETRGASWELYGHWQAEWDANPAQIRTDVYYQVVPAAR